MFSSNLFEGKNEINIVFLGGSITEGAGASCQKNCYANRVGEWFKSTYGNKMTVNYHNKGVGGTDSQYGLLRLTRDVISLNPDVVFIEFAVNDAGNDLRRYVESIVRSLIDATNPYIIFLYTTDANYTTVTKYHEEVANHYGIPQISLKDALKRELCGKNAKELGYLKDNVHPTDKGYDVYYREIIKLLQSGNYFKKPIPAEKIVTNSCSVDTKFISSAGNDVTRTGTWETNVQNPNRPWAKTVTVGDSISFSFEGNVFAIEHGLHLDSTMYEIIIDGKTVSTVHPVYADIKSNQLVIGYVTFDLDYGVHDVVIRTIKCTNECYSGTQVLIYNFITGNTIK